MAGPIRQHRQHMSSLPSPDELRAFCAGTLAAERFAEVDRWLVDLPENEAERVLAQAGIGGADRPLVDIAAPTSRGFVSDLPRGRLRTGNRLGEGGMAMVSAAHDRVLDRMVAVKVLKPRRVDEPLEQFHLREASFRREAALTAGLVHPSIPPIYDVGSDGGLPAFAMQRLNGSPLNDVISDGGLPLGERLEILLRVAEAVGYAHSRGIVHRDLTPRNILIAEHGAVYVLDWGVAAACGTQDGVRAGTPDWMSPEQTAGAAADPRMDVFALGALVRYILAGHRIPTGLSALIQHCQAADPAKRYADGRAVAEDLRHWLSEGVTIAQQANRLELAWLRMRRSPHVMTGIYVAATAMILVVALWWAQRSIATTEAEARITQITSTTSLDRTEAVAVALDEVRSIRIRFPRLASAQAMEARLLTAHDLSERSEQLERVRTQLNDLLHRTRTLGPWADQVSAWRAAIHDAGLAMHADQVAEDAARLREHPLRDLLTASLAFLWRAEKERGGDYHAEQTALLLANAGPTPGWQALGRLLGRTAFTAHEPVFCHCDDAAGVLTESAPTAVALALFAPEARLTAVAREALRQHPGDFWPLMASARASLVAGDVQTAERLALIASGAEPDSLLPALLLAYTALQRDNQTGLAQAVAHSVLIAPGNIEVRTLQAVLLARDGHSAEAQGIVDRLDGEHLQHHRARPDGHPMERSVQALVNAGLRLPGMHHSP